MESIDKKDKGENNLEIESSVNFKDTNNGRDLKGNKSGGSSATSANDFRGERRSANTSSPWPSKEEFATFYESSVSVDVASLIWKSVHRKPNEMPKLVTEKELSKHNMKINAWMSLFGKVYDVSGFIDRHPGGYETIEQGIGRDATEIFNKAHSFVDYEKILLHDFIGLYMPKIPQKVTKTKGSNCCTELGNIFIRSCKTKKNLETRFDLKFTENIDYIVLMISATPPEDVILSRDSWTVILWDSQYLLVKSVLTPPTCWIAEYFLKEAITYEYIYVDFKNEFKRISILIKKPKKGMWNTLGEPHLENNCSVIDRADQIEDETLCQIFYRQNLTPNVILVGFKVRPSSFLGIPIGYSIRLTINGVSSWFTPVVYSLINKSEPPCSTQGESIYIIIKITPEIILSGIVNEIPINTKDDPLSYITMGCALGTFNMNYLEDVDVLVLLTSGTGIAPMIRIVQYYLEKDQGSLRDKHVILMYFNKKSSDIIWKDELGLLDDTNNWFHVFLVVEEEDKNWDGLRGALSVHLVKWCLETVSGVSPELKMKGVASGDESFIAGTERLFNLMKDYFDKTFTFVDVYG